MKNINTKNLLEIFDKIQKENFNQSYYTFSSILSSNKKFVFNANILKNKFYDYSNNDYLKDLINFLYFSNFNFSLLLQNKENKNFSVNELFYYNIFLQIEKNLREKYKKNLEKISYKLYIKYKNFIKDKNLFNLKNDLVNGKTTNNLLKNNIFFLHDFNIYHDNIIKNAKKILHDLTQLKEKINLFLISENNNKYIIHSLFEELYLLKNFSSLLHKEKDIFSLKNGKNKELRKKEKINRISHSISWIGSRMMAIGEGIVPGFGMYTLFLHLGIPFYLSIIIGIMIGISGLIANITLVEKDIFDVIHIIYSGELFKDSNGEKIYGIAKVILIFLGMLSINTGLVYTALAGNTLFTSLNALFIFLHLKKNIAFTLSIVSLIFPIGTFIGLTCAFGVVFIILIKEYYINYKNILLKINNIALENKRYSIIQFINKLFPQINDTYKRWKLLDAKSKGLILFNKIFSLIKLSFILLINFVVIIISFAVFRKSIIKMLNNIYPYNIKYQYVNFLGKFFAFNNTIVTSNWGFNKMKNIFYNITIKDMLKNIISFPIFIINYFFNIITLYDYRSQIQDLNFFILKTLFQQLYKEWIKKVVGIKAINEIYNINYLFDIKNGLRFFTILFFPIILGYHILSVFFDISVFFILGIISIYPINNINKYSLSIEHNIKNFLNKKLNNFIKYLFREKENFSEKKKYMHHYTTQQAILDLQSFKKNSNKYFNETLLFSNKDIKKELSFFISSINNKESISIKQKLNIYNFLEDKYTKNIKINEKYMQHQLYSALIHSISNSGGQAAIMEYGGSPALNKFFTNSKHPSFAIRFLAFFSEGLFSFSGNYFAQKNSILQQRSDSQYMINKISKY